jgi:hypothetical protein
MLMLHYDGGFAIQHYDSDKELLLHRYSGFLTPLFPLNIFPISLLIFFYLKKRRVFASLFVSIILILSATSFRYMAPLLFIPFVSTIDYKKGDKLLMIGDILLQSYASVTSFIESSSLLSYLEGLKIWGTYGKSEIVIFHLVLLVTLLSIDYFTFASQKLGVGRFLAEDPSRPPIIYFILILLYAAVLLAFGKEGAANRAAELSYYFLVIGVSIAIKQITLQEEQEEEKREA